MSEVLVLYYSHHGAIEKLANLIARGINSVDGVTARVRTVPSVKVITESTTNTAAATAQNTTSSTKPNSVAYATYTDLKECAGLALGSPVRFGNMASSLKYFLDGTIDSWLSGGLVGKPACVFTSSGSMHGGQEACLLSMMLPLLHHGMLLMGLPYTAPDLMNTTTGGTPYGLSHWAGASNENEISDSEKQLAWFQGKRLAETVLKLS